MAGKLRKMGRCGSRFTLTTSTAASTLANFIVMAFCLSFNHGVVSTLVALASNQFAELGGLTNGVMYITYTVSSVTISALVVNKLGAKYTISLGLVLCCAYVGLYYYATTVEGDTKRTAVFLGSFLGGLGSGVMWTAQGQYFQCSSLIYAQHAQISDSQATGLLAGIFTGIYMGTEVLLKVTSSILVLDDAYLYFLLCTVAVSGCIVAIDNVPPAAGGGDESWAVAVLSAATLLRQNPYAVLLLPANFTFGFAAAMLQYYANKTIVPPNLSDPTRSNIGFAASIAVGSGAIASVVFGQCTGRLGKFGPIIAGNVLFAAVALCFVVFTPAQLTSWVAVAPLYCMYGVGRGVWEGVNKAIYADVFPNDSAAAFANITFQSGFAASLAFFVFPELPPAAMAAFVIASAGLAVPGALMTRRRLHEQHAGTNAQRTKLLVDDPHPQHRLT